MLRITSDPSILSDKELNFVDMHHHSNISDAERSPEFLAKVFRKKGVGLCITDHNQIRGSVYLSEQKDIFTIPSIEVTSKQSKDILGYFYSIADLTSFWENDIRKNIRNNAVFNLNRTTLDTFDVVEKIKAHNGIPILAHPFSPMHKDSFKLLLDRQFVKEIKGIESHNFSTGNYKKTSDFVKQFNKPQTAGSDSHNISSLQSLTGTPHFDVDSFLDAVLKKENTIYYEEGGFLKRFNEKLTVLKNDIHLIAPKNE